MDLSIIILSYKSKKHLEVLLPSIFGSGGVSFIQHPHPTSPVQGEENADNGYLSRTENTAIASTNVPLPRREGTGEGDEYTAEVIVVDNDSRDGTLEWLQTTNYKLQTIPNENNGFAQGNNLGIKQSSGRYVLLLNPDTKVAPDTFKTMLDFMEARPEAGISGCKLVKANGRLDLACRRRFPNPWNSFKRLFLKNNADYNYGDASEDESMEVDSVVGAFLLIRRTVMDKIGLLDEDFFMYGEDLDWCWRCKEAGYKVWYYPKTTVLHYKGESSRKAPFKMLKAFHDAMWIFYRKHYAARYPFVFNWIVWLGIYGRLSVLLMINLFKTDRRVSV